MPFAPQRQNPVTEAIYAKIEEEGYTSRPAPIFLEAPSIRNAFAENEERYKKYRFYQLYVEYLQQSAKDIRPQKMQSSDLFVLDGADRIRYLANVEEMLSKLLNGECEDDFSSKKAFVELDTFLVMVFLSFFFGVSKYLTVLQSRKEFTEKQKVAISTLCKDANYMKAWSGCVLKALSEANKDNYEQVYHNKIECPIAQMFSSRDTTLHKYVYDENGALRTVLNRNGLTGKNFDDFWSWTGWGNRNFIYNWAWQLDRVSTRDNDTLSYIEDNYYSADIIIPFVKDMYALGGDYVCWPLVNTYYNLTDKITQNRLNRERNTLKEHEASIEKTCQNALVWARKVAKQMPEESK